jgi:hypothetical protein
VNDQRGSDMSASRSHVPVTLPGASDGVGLAGRGVAGSELADSPVGLDGVGEAIGIVGLGSADCDDDGMAAEHPPRATMPVRTITASEDTRDDGFGPMATPICFVGRRV